MMLRWLIGVGMIGLAAVAQANPGCGAALQTRYVDVDRVAGSLHVYKPGQARVFAFDGSEYTGGESLWMQGQLRRVVRLCTRSRPQDGARAARVIGEVESLVQARERYTPPAFSIPASPW